MNGRRAHPFAVVTALLAAVLLAGCIGPQATAGTIEVRIHADGRSLTQTVASGSTVQQALDAADLTLGQLDKVDPPAYTVVTDGTDITITRVTERFEIEQVVIPFERQTLRNESLPAGETRLLQAGSNGQEEITYRIVEEAGKEISRNPVRQQVIQPPQPEIVMIGGQESYTPVEIAGRLAYLSNGNAWLMAANTGNRRPLVVTGDLDGRVFKLSPDGHWLLFTRHTDNDETNINSLWVVSTTDAQAQPVSLDVQNIIHFADWSPKADPLMIAYSTADPSPAAPGWQANNDLQLLVLSAEGRVIKRTTLIGTNAGGEYGWWGTNFAWAPDGVHLAYARADGVGEVDIRNPEMDSLVGEVPFQTLGDWAWVPGVAWGLDSRTLFLVDHGAPVGIESAAASPVFDLVALPPSGTAALDLASRTGMFALPSTSPADVLASGETAYRVAFYQASSPLDSQDSSYRLVAMDRDGSNRLTLFPAQGDPGLKGDDLQRPPAWSPDGTRLAVVYGGDLYLVDSVSGQAQRLTGDAQTSAYDWKP